MESLTLCNLSIGYGRHVVGAQLSARVAAGGVTLLLGRNGCGKSTLLHCLGGLLPPLAGEVWWDGSALYECTPQERARRVAFLLTTRPAAISLTVQDVLETARLPHRGATTSSADRLATLRAAQRCGVADWLSRPLHTLSDGQVQWVMLARTLAQDTPLLLLDEPTAHLDLPGKRALFALLMNLAREEGRTIIASTHDLLPICHEVSAWWLLHEGRLLCGSPTDTRLRQTIGEALETVV